jgi:hypothetical protein
MKFRSVVLLVLGVVFVVAGSVIWRSRFAYSPEQILQQRFGSRLFEVPSKTTVDLSEACRVATEEGGWVAFILNANITNDPEVRTFFETAEEPSGLWVEYESGAFRLGLGMGPGNIDEDGNLVSSTQLPIRLVHRTEEAQVFIAVTEDTTRLVTNTRDTSIAWPGTLADEWKCTAVRIADDTRAGTEGNTCKGCNVRLRYMTGRDDSELNEILDSVSNVRQFNVRRWTGSSLSLLGFAAVALAIRGASRQRRQVVYKEKSPRDEY